MSMDRTLTCSDCRSEFTFTGGEQDFYAEKGFSEPRRCPSCRAAKRAARDSGSSYGGASYDGASYGGASYGSASSSYRSGPREMFSATCASCGREARVPFNPTSGKPVYCSDCFRSR